MNLDILTRATSVDHHSNTGLLRQGGSAMPLLPGTRKRQLDISDFQIEIAHGRLKTERISAALVLTSAIFTAPVSPHIPPRTYFVHTFATHGRIIVHRRSSRVSNTCRFVIVPGDQHAWVPASTRNLAPWFGAGRTQRRAVEAGRHIENSQRVNEAECGVRRRAAAGSTVQAAARGRP